jgi:hypothetical protein
MIDATLTALGRDPLDVDGAGTPCSPRRARGPSRGFEAVSGEPDDALGRHLVPVEAESRI